MQITNHIPWKYECGIDDTNTLFSRQSLPYVVQAYVCSCGALFSRLVSNCHYVDEYVCTECGNELFYDSISFYGNSVWYEPIDKIFLEKHLRGLLLDVAWDGDNQNVIGSIYINIPTAFDYITDKVSYAKKNLYQLFINYSGVVRSDRAMVFDCELPIDDCALRLELCTGQPLLRELNDKMLSFIASSSIFSHISLIKECRYLDEAVFFLKYPNLIEFEFYRWRDADNLPSDRELTILGALEHISNHRKEKSLKKAIYANYRWQMKIYGDYCFAYIYAVTKYIKDVNIARRMARFDLRKLFLEETSSLPFVNLMDYLTKRYSYQQIENLFIEYQELESFWLIDTINLLMSLEPDSQESLPVPPCKCADIHNSLAEYHRFAMLGILSNITFRYTKKELCGCVNIGEYSVNLPMSGTELYGWSNELNNCLTGYWHEINSKQSIVYGFFLKDKLKFAVEIQNKKIIQARAKHNRGIEKKESDMLDMWFLTYIAQQAASANVTG